ncbi:MAG: hypothetical protein QXL79_04130 [Sulfolobales archaeon]
MVCGRKFPDGQGIIIKIVDREIAFHSSKCAAKFYKMLIDRGSKEVISESLKLAKELESVLIKRIENASKKI